MRHEEQCGGRCVCGGDRPPSPLMGERAWVLVSGVQQIECADGIGQLVPHRAGPGPSPAPRSMWYPVGHLAVGRSGSRQCMREMELAGWTGFVDLKNINCESWI
jgi:hypothetical protein